MRKIYLRNTQNTPLLTRLSGKFFEHAIALGSGCSKWVGCCILLRWVCFGEDLFGATHLIALKALCKCLKI